jgi:hypothetical protein
MMALLGTASMAAALLTAPSAVAAPSTAQSPDPNLTVKSVTLGRSAVLVSGLNRVAVGVTVKAGYSDTETPLNVLFKRTGGVGPLKYMIAGQLKRTGGPLNDGTWTGTVDIPSTANGTFKVYGVLPGYLQAGDMTTETPFDGPSIAVTGVHLPKLAVQVIPRVVPFGSPYQVKAVIYDSATAKPYGVRLPLVVAVDDACAERGGIPRLTDTAGVLYTSFPAVTADWLNCVRVPGGGRFFDTLGLGFFPLRPGIVAAIPSKTRVPVSTLVPVNGSVAGAPYRCPVQLQRLHGRTAWRLANQSTVRASGRFTVVAQPPNLGNNSYRVYFPTCDRFQAGYSRTFAIQGI